MKTSFWHTYASLKCLCIELFDNFLLANIKTIEKQKESFLPFVDICFRSRDMSIQNLKKEIEHFVPL